MALDNFQPTKQGLPNYEGKLLFALGSILLLLIIIVTATGSWFIMRNHKTEKIRLGATVTHVISHSIEKVSFSGKYHTRLLVENLVQTNSEIAYIIVVDKEGTIFAHSNPDLNDQLDNDAGTSAAKQIIGGATDITQELVIDGQPVTEFDVPFTGGYGNQLMGVIRVGISQGPFMQAQQESFLYIIILVVLLVIVSLLAIFRISRYFAAPVNNMALTLKGIMSHAPLAIFMQNSNQILVGANNRFIQTFGLAPRFLGKSSIYEALPQTFNKECSGLDRDVFHSRHSIQREQTLLTHEGERRFLTNRFPVAVDRNGKVEEICTFLLDITETQQLEQQLRHSQKMEAVGHLAGGLAHDFNNLLTGIIGYADLTKIMSDENPEISRNMDDLLIAANRAAELTTGLLAFSRKQLLDPKTIALDALVMRMETLLLNVVGETIALHINDCTDPPLLVRADESQIEQVLLNLLSNAKDAMPEGGEISLSYNKVTVNPTDPAVGSLLEPGSYGVLTVEDNGCGMSHAIQKNVFEPFFTTKPKGKGTGLGLSTAYGIIKQHKGEIILNSSEGHGSTFHIYLPTGVETPKMGQQEIPKDTVAPRGMETILLAEDEQLVRHLIRSILVGAGYKVITARDGQHAVAQYIDHKDAIDLILMDVIMPQLNGREALDQIQTQSPDIPCIFMSGYTAEILAQDNIMDGTYDFLAKPLRRDELLQIIRKVIER